MSNVSFLSPKYFMCTNCWDISQQNRYKTEKGKPTKSYQLGRFEFLDKEWWDYLLCDFQR